MTINAFIPIATMNKIGSTCTDRIYRKDTLLSMCRPELEHGASQYYSIGNFESNNRNESELLIVVLIAKN